LKEPLEIFRAGIPSPVSSTSASTFRIESCLVRFYVACETDNDALQRIVQSPRSTSKIGNQARLNARSVAAKVEDTGEGIPGEISSGS